MRIVLMMLAAVALVLASGACSCDGGPWEFEFAVDGGVDKTMCASACIEYSEGPGYYHGNGNASCSVRETDGGQTVVHCVNGQICN